MKDLRYLEAKDKFLEYAYLALREHFSSRDDFVKYFDAIKGDGQKNLFLRTASFYLFLVKQGNWMVDVPGSDKAVDYLNNTYKYVGIFSLMESLSQEKFMDFYQFLTRRKPQVEFPINDKSSLDEHYRKYKEEFGSINRCISFFRTLSAQRQDDLISRVEGIAADATIENLARSLYDMRSKFLHRAELVLHMSEETSIGQTGDKLIVCNLSITDAMLFFEEGLIEHFRGTET